VRLARPLDVIDVVAAAGNKTPVLDPADRLTDAELLHCMTSEHLPVG
jgi:hypothetical protein